MSLMSNDCFFFFQKDKGCHKYDGSICMLINLIRAKIQIVLVEMECLLWLYASELKESSWGN